MLLLLKNAVAVDYSQGDSLFMHADTLQMYTYYLNTDSMFRETRAYHKVRMYRTDVQGYAIRWSFPPRIAA